MRRIESGMVLDRVWIEDDHVRVVALLQPPAPIQPEVLGRKCRQAPHRVLERNNTFLTHVLRQQPGEAAVSRWMRTRLQKHSFGQ